MLLNDFDFDLPQELIASFPLEQRSASRLLHLQRKTGQIIHRQFTDLPDLFSPQDLLIFNDTRVIPARLFGKKSTGGKIEILVERVLDQQRVLAHVKPGKSLKSNGIVYLENNIAVKIIARQGELWELLFISDHSVSKILNDYGHIPLPPYMNRADQALDQERYQTIFAKEEGAVAAPTAGLHFDTALMQKLKDKNIQMGFITLHVGAGTFLPVRVDNILQHKMHAEQVSVSSQICEQIKLCKQKGGRVIAVGTTVVRSLETAMQTGNIQPYYGETDIFIYPGYQFRCVDAMITNFHVPKSTLLMLVSAFADREKILKAYQEAIAQRYRFFSYGDAMFIS